MQVKRRKSVVRRENASYWMSYSDVMAALLLMLSLLLFFYVNQYMTAQQNREQEVAAKEAQLRTQEDLLAQTESLLAQKAEELALANATLTNQQFELDDKNLKLEESLAKLAQQQLDIEEQKALVALAIQEADKTRAQLEGKQAELDQTAARLTQQDIELALQQLDVDRLKQLLETQTQQIGQQQMLIDQMIGVRAAIISQLGDALARAGANVNVDQNTGAITLSNSIIFDYNSSDISADGKALLNKVIPAYVRTLLDGDNSQYVSELIIEGHTDKKGSYEFNLNLSQQRAYNVVSYCLSNQMTGLTAQEKQALREKLTANGRSFSEPILNADGSENADASRRVEFKFRLKDDEMIDSMSAILSGMSENVGQSAAE
ncbi:MAG: OmpA family protein [Oscillospiraceae bacterium]|nr:OmpA family protein [Oscillospiraceae bacterium]